MCSPASFETAYVQRASPTEPIVETCPSSTRKACVPKTSLVEKSTKRSRLSSVADRRLEHVVGADHVHAHRPHRALEHGVDAGDRRAVDDVRRAGGELASSRRASSTSAWWSVKFGCSASGVPESASRCRLSTATISFSSTSCRASVVPMKPAPPVMKIRLPLSTRRVYRRATVFPGMRTALADRSSGRRRRRVRREPGRRRLQTPETQLTITYWPEGRGDEEPKTWTLRCDPAGGTVPRVAAVCRQLDATGEAVRAGRARTSSARDQYGGPQQALIAGTHEGKRDLGGDRDAERLRDRAREAARVPRAGLLRQSQCVRRAARADGADRARPGRLRRRRRTAATRAATAAIDLTLTLWPNGEAGDSITWTLQCEPTGGDHPDPEAACAALTAVADPFGPVAPPERCAEIPGGDEDVAVLDGDYRGRDGALALHARERVRDAAAGTGSRRSSRLASRRPGYDRARREDRPLRRRRAPPAPRDPAGEGARPPRRRRRPQPRRARARRWPTSARPSTSRTSRRSPRSARRHAVDGVLTVSADRAVPVVAAVAEALGLPGIGTETAHLMTHKIAMRRTLADAGVPQPRFAGAARHARARAPRSTPSASRRC